MTTQPIRQSLATSQRLFVPALFYTGPRPEGFGCGPAVPPPPPENMPAGAATGPTSTDSQGAPGNGSMAALSPEFQWLVHIDFQKKLEQTAIQADPLRNPIRATVLNMKMAQLPACVVEDMYFAEVGHISAPGGVGKTTVMLHHCIQIAIGGEIFGKAVRQQGPVVYLTGEDNAQTILHCLWQMCKGLEPDDLAMVERNVLILDVTGHAVKLTKVERDGSIGPSDRVGTLITTLKSIDPVMLFIDPAVSFGVGEGRVNDAEQGLIEVARRIVRQVGCGVIYIHHTGKTGVREGEGKQYSGRGGSAFSDGSRMVFTLENVLPDKWTEATGEVLDEAEEIGLLFSLPKMKLTKKQPPIYVKRTEFSFERVERVEDVEGAQVAREGNAATVEKFLRDEWPKGGRHKKDDLWALKVLKKRDALRAAISLLLTTGRVVEEEGPSTGGRPPKYLRPRDVP